MYSHSAGDPELKRLGQVAFYLATTLLIGSWIAVALRLWVRFRITKSPGRDDVAMVSTLLLFTIYCSLIVGLILRMRSGNSFTLEGIKGTLLLIQLSEISYVLTTTLLKISLGLFFLRVLTKKWQRSLFHVILVVSAVYGILYVFVSIFQCGDPAKLADSLRGSKKCLPRAFLLGSGYVYGILNIIADWTFVLIPIVVLLDSEIDRRSKISVSIVMALGAIGSVSSVFRMVYLEGLQLGGVGVSTASIKATIWATAEPGTGIIAASIAIMRPLVRKLASDTRGRVVEYKMSRKASLPRSIYKIDTTATDSVIALTDVEKKDKNKMSWYSSQDEEAWSPTVTVGQASVQRVTNIQMNNGKALPARPSDV